MNQAQPAAARDTTSPSTDQLGTTTTERPSTDQLRTTTPADTPTTDQLRTTRSDDTTTAESERAPKPDVTVDTTADHTDQQQEPTASDGTANVNREQQPDQRDADDTTPNTDQIRTTTANRPTTDELQTANLLDRPTTDQLRTTVPEDTTNAAIKQQPERGATSNTARPDTEQRQLDEATAADTRADNADLRGDVGSGETGEPSTGSDAAPGRLSQGNDQRAEPAGRDGLTARTEGETPDNRDRPGEVSSGETGEPSTGSDAAPGPPSRENGRPVNGGERSSVDPAEPETAEDKSPGAGEIRIPKSLAGWPDAVSWFEGLAANEQPEVHRMFSEEDIFSYRPAPTRSELRSGWRAGDFQDVVVDGANYAHLEDSLAADDILNGWNETGSHYSNAVLDAYATEEHVTIAASPRATSPETLDTTPEMRAAFVAGLKDEVSSTAASAYEEGVDASTRDGTLKYIDGSSGDFVETYSEGSVPWPADVEGKPWQVDHVVELQHGGSDSPRNYFPVPIRLHSAKTQALRRWGEMMKKTGG